MENTTPNQAYLAELATSLGASLVGFCKCETAFTPLAPHLQSAISIAVKISDTVLSTIEDKPSYIYFQQYRTANALLDSIAFRLGQEIEKMGYDAMPIAASQSQGKEGAYYGVVPHKTVAVLSGLGFVGKSGLFISTEYGSKIRLATILTDMPLERTRALVPNGCGACEKCKNACPAGAIFGIPPKTNGERNFDPDLCSHYMKAQFQDIGRGSVCGICIKVCPYNHL